MAAATVDTAYLAASYSISETTIASLLDSPTRELVQSLLQQLEIKAKEFEQVQAEKLRSDVELENAVRGTESRTRSLKASVDKGLKENAELRTKLNDAGTSSGTLENVGHD